MERRYDIKFPSRVVYSNGHSHYMKPTIQTFVIQEDGNYLHVGGFPSKVDPLTVLSYRAKYEGV